MDEIRWVERKGLDVEKFDALVNSISCVGVYQQSWYLDCVCDNWGAFVIGEYQAVLPIAYTIKFGQKIIYQPYFTREFNPSGSKITLFEIEQIIGIELKEINKIQYCTHQDFEIKGLDKTQQKYQFLDMKIGYEGVRKNYSKNAKRLIKKAQKKIYTIEESDNTEEFVLFFQKHTGGQVDYTKRHYDNLSRLISQAVKNKKGNLFIVKNEINEVVAQGFYLFHGKRVYYLKGSTNAEGKKNGAMFLLMDYVIKEYSTTCTIFDFGGSRIESISGFYKRFGAIDDIYYEYTRNDLPWILKKGKKIKELFKK